MGLRSQARGTAAAPAVPAVRGRLVGAVAALALAGLAVWLHRRAGASFPRPWPDEPHFLAPAISLARTGSLGAPQLGLPGGIFWMPSGSYVAWAPAMALGEDLLRAGRAVSLLGMLTFAGGTAWAALRWRVPAVLVVAATGAWLVMPRVVMGGNLVRMEPLVLAVTGVALALLASRRPVAAVAVAALAPTFHAQGAMPLLAVAAVAAPVWWGDGRRLRPGEAAAVAVAGLLLLAQGAYAVAHLDGFLAHLGWQLRFKAGQPRVMGLGQGVLLAVAVALLALAVAGRDRLGDRVAGAVALPAVAVALVVVDVVGNVQWYEVLGVETAAYLTALGAAAAVPAWRRPTGAVRAVLAATAAALVGWSGLQAALTEPLFGMRADPAVAADYDAFVALAVDRLRALDAASDGPTVVAVDPLSGFGHELYAREWEHLQVVHPTPLSPADPTVVDWWVLTPGAPFTTASLLEPWGNPPPTEEVRSPAGVFALQLVANPAAAGPSGG